MCKYPNSGKVTKNKTESGKANETILSYDAGIPQIYLTSDLIVHEAAYEGDVFHFYVSSSLDYGVCPYCGSVSNRVHSKYCRTIQDLSLLGREVVLHLETRKFFCHNEACCKKTFAEQPGDEIFRYRRRTCRCERAVARHGICASSGFASLQLSRMGIYVSPSTVLRDLHRMKPPKYGNVTEIGVDDWAWRKGVTYGSIIIDYANGLPIDLLGSRETESFRQWMEGHAKVHTVSRDRSTDYSAAIASTGRRITEVADKFHLVKNIMDRMAGLVAEKYADYRQAVRNQEGTKVGVEEPVVSPVAKECPGKKPDLREVMFREVKELQRKGFKPATIAKKLGIARMTATKYCKMDLLPHRNSKLRNEYHRYDGYVEQEAANGKPLSTIYQEIRNKGFQGSLSPFYEHYKYLSDGHRGYRPRNWSPCLKKEKPQDDRSELLPVKSISSLTGKVLKGKALDETQQKNFETLMSLGWFKEMYEATAAFCKVINGNETTALVRWMKLYWKTSVSSLRTFIIGIRKDFQAVRNTIKYNITNGITEGFVNKLKAIKRNMYGKAGLDLLKNKLVLEHVLFN